MGKAKKVEKPEKVRRYKCTYCKEYIDESEMHLEPQRVGKKGRKENRNIKLNANGEIIYSRYHKNCFDFVEQKRIEWDNLYQYILKTYYIKEVPPYLITELQKMQIHYGYALILDCMESLESNIRRYMREDGFEANQKTSYILNALKNNIDEFYRKTLKKESDMQNTKVENFQFIDNSRRKQPEVYDIIDLD